MDNILQVKLPFLDMDEADKSELSASFVDGRVMRVLVPYAVDKAYDYIFPDGMNVCAGSYVCVPLGGRYVSGVVWGDGEGRLAPEKLKAAVSVYDILPMSDVHRQFIDWVSHYTVSARGSVLKMSLSVLKALESPKPFTAYTLVDGFEQKCASGLTPQRQKVLDVLRDRQPRRMVRITEESGCSSGVVKGLVKKGYVKTVEIVSVPPCRNPDFKQSGAVLSDIQQEAAEHLIKQVRSGGYCPMLLDGVTGAGKTEVYFQAVSEALKRDKQVLILLPEIALSNAFLERFKIQFNCAPALWHSGLSDSIRRRTWRGVAKGETKVVVGARSALFLPYRDLGVIVVDEEHDPAYKQEDGVLYHARDMAVVRAHLARIPIVLVSATPSLETMHNVWDGRYTHLHLPDRYGGARLPDIDVIDLRADKLERLHFLSSTLKTMMFDTVQRGEQMLLFLNRRGYAPLTLCRGC